MNTELDPDAELMFRLANGQDSALNELMNRWRQSLVSFILRYTQNQADSLDLAQETFVRVYQHRNRFNFKSKFSTWLFTIATNLCRNHARSRERHPTVSLENDTRTDVRSGQDPTVSHEDTPSESLERSELAQQVREAIGKLSHDLKTVVLLYEYEGLSYEEIARILGCTQKAVETRLYRARNALRKLLAEI